MLFDITWAKSAKGKFALYSLPIEYNACKMHIPKRLNETLEKDAALLGAVKSSIAEFEPWIKSSNLPFFPEYTDHGPEHIEHVLQTADALMSNESREVITPGDVATLILAILLHDAAMHLNEDSFCL